MHLSVIIKLYSNIGTLSDARIFVCLENVGNFSNVLLKGQWTFRGWIFICEQSAPYKKPSTYFNNWFTSIPLVTNLANKEIFCLGTVQMKSTLSSIMYDSGSQTVRRDALVRHFNFAKELHNNFIRSNTQLSK